jgi:hypothetical protein
MIKLKKIINESFSLDDDKPKIDKKKVMESVSMYSELGKSIYREQSIMEVASQLVEVMDGAKGHILAETDADWFDKVSINRNMKTMDKHVTEFKKTAKDAHSLQERMVDLYENIGFTLGKYYDIKELKKDDEDDGKINEDYADDFKALMKKYNITSPNQLKGDNKKKFFDEADAIKDAGENETD